MDIASIANYLALAVYAGTWIYLIVHYSKQAIPPKNQVILLAGIATIAHTVGVYYVVLRHGALHTGVFKLTSLFLWAMNVLVLVSGIKKPLYNLFIFLFPLTTVAILVSEFSTSAKVSSTADLFHILLAVLATGFLTVAALQGILLSFQNRQLKHKHMTGAVALLPPLQTMERLMFEMLWVGQALLTLLILSGLLITRDIREQNQGHTLVFSILAWMVYAILLWGRVRLGWRGKIAVRWTLGGFFCLLLAYFTTQLVYQVILA